MWRATTRPPRCCWKRCGARVRRPAGPGQQHGRVRRGCRPLPGPRAGGTGTPAGRRPGRRPLRARLPPARLRTADGLGAGRRIGAGRSPQRLRRHQAPPGAPLRTVGPGRRGDGRGAALPQRLRAPDATGHALRRSGLDLPQRPRRRPARPGVRGRGPDPRLRPRARRRPGQRPRPHHRRLLRRLQHRQRHTPHRPRHGHGPHRRLRPRHPPPRGPGRLAPRRRPPHRRLPPPGRRGTQLPRRDRVRRRNGGVRPRPTTCRRRPVTITGDGPRPAEPPAAPATPLGPVSEVTRPATLVLFAGSSATAVLLSAHIARGGALLTVRWRLLAEMAVWAAAWVVAVAAAFRLPRRTAVALIFLVAVALRAGGVGGAADDDG